MNKHPDNALLLYASDSHACPYLPNKEAITAFVDPQLDMTTALYARLLDLGFRRSGSQVYRPHCTACDRCIAARLSTANFNPNRNQRRCLNKHSNTRVVTCEAEFKPTHLELYNKYLSNRHSDSDMGGADQNAYLSFLSSDWCNTQFFEFYSDQTLFAVAAVDVLTTGLSAVYTFFDPAYAALSPGQFAILWLLDEARRRDLQWLYLGYWVPGCDKMSYKSNYRPIEFLIEQTWRTYPRNTDLPY